MSNFTRNIGNMEALQHQLKTDGFLEAIKSDLIQTGRAFLAFRNDEATIYYNGNQLCNLPGSQGYEPMVYNHYLPITRSRTLSKKQKKEPYTIEQWQNNIDSEKLSFKSVFNEILDNLEKESSPESLQASRFYRFSPLNTKTTPEIVLLDIEAAFSSSDEKTDRIDLVFYHRKDRRLMFVEVKRLSDPRLDPKGKESADVIDQLKRYKDRLETEVQQITSQYNNSIDYYNTLSGGNLPHVSLESPPLLGLLLVEFNQSALAIKKKNEVQEMITRNGFKWYAIGDTSNVKEDSTMPAIYKALK